MAATHRRLDQTQATQKLSAQVYELQWRMAMLASSAPPRGSVDTEQIVNGAVTYDQISAGSIHTDSMTAGSITGDRITAGTLNADRITSGTITTTQIDAGGVNADRLVAGSITTVRMSAGTINADRLQAGTITTSLMTAGTINADRIQTGSITTTLMQAGTINADRLQAGTIATAHMTAGSIDADRLLAGSITTSLITAGTINADRITSGTITTALMAAGTINADRLVAGTVTATLLSTDVAMGNKILANLLTATNITTNGLAAISANIGTVTSGTVTGATIRTAASGPRVLMNTGGITAYGLDGTTPVLSFDVSTGNLALAGTVTANATSILPVAALVGELSGYNLLLNSSFENAASGLTGWTTQAGVQTVVDLGTGAYHGSKVLRFETLDALNVRDNANNRARVTEGRPYTFSFFARTVNGGGTAVARLFFFNALTGGAQVGATLDSAAVTLTSAWQRITISTTAAPAGAVSARVGMRVTPTTASSFGYADAAALTESERPLGYAPSIGEILPGSIRGGLDGAASMIVAGTIVGGDLVADTITATQIAANAITTTELNALAVTAAKIASGTITSTQIQAGSITADRLNVTQLSAITANLGTITAGTITGATFQTATSGARVVMDASGLRYIGSDSVVAVNLDATLGGLVLKAHTDFTKPDRTIRFIDTGTGATDVGRIAGWDNGGDSSGLYLYGQVTGSRGGGVIIDTHGPTSTFTGTPRAILQATASPVTGLGYVLAQTVSPAGTTYSAYVLRQDGKSDFARGTEIGTRVTRGILVTTTPTIDYGSGFSVTRLGVGSIRITFSPTFVASPAVQITVEDANPVAARITGRNAGTSVDIQLWNTSTGNAVDTRLHFTATGAMP